LAIGTEGLIVEVNLDSVIGFSDNIVVDFEGEGTDKKACEEESGFHRRIYNLIYIYLFDKI
jgi:hypothetical protein